MVEYSLLMAASSAWGAKATTRSRTDNLLSDRRPRRSLVEAGEGYALSVSSCLLGTGEVGKVRVRRTRGLEGAHEQ